MKKIIKICSIILVAVILIIFLLIVLKNMFLPNFVKFQLEAMLKKEVEFKKMSMEGISKLRFLEVVIKDNSSPFFYAYEAEVDFNILTILQPVRSFKVHLEHAGFSKGNILESVFQVISVDSAKGTDFDSVEIYLTRGSSVEIKELKAVNKFMTINAKGIISGDKKIDFDLKIALSKTSLDSIEEAVKDSFSGEIDLNKNTIDFKIRGDLARPVISVKAKFFEEDNVKLEVKPILKK